MSAGEFLHLKPAPPGATCWAHPHTTEWLLANLLAEMRRTHGKGGVNVCVDCIERLRATRPRRSP